MPVHSKLRGTIVQLASDFAEGVLEALRNVSLEDLLAEAGTLPRPAGARARTAEPPVRTKPKRARRLARRSPADIARVVDRVVALLAQHPKGLRSEEIQAKLGLAAKEMPRPLADALAAHRITRRGQKRATTYLAGRAPASGKTAKSAREATKVARKASAKPAAKRAARAGAASKPPKAPKAAKKGRPAKSAKTAANGAPAPASGAAGAPS